MLTGATAILLHARFRNPIHLPGHHGIEFMALATFMAMRMKFKTRGLFFALGTGSMLFVPFLGFTDPIAQIVFMLPPIVLCVLMDAFKAIKKLQFFALPLFGGLAYMMIPLVRLFVHSTTGFPYKSIMIHPVYTITMHFAFGVAGTLLGYSIYRGLKSL
ncbi:MAG: hypothetical protein C0592_14360 [Marinilabiliales bacterium]|nr:MAG: hypothetical protein C0592_14360 [Marinilabiliales bacterium]